jgi:hypothetical protein
MTRTTVILWGLAAVTVAAGALVLTFGRGSHGRPAGMAAAVARGRVASRHETKGASRVRPVQVTPAARTAAEGQGDDTGDDDGEERARQSYDHYFGQLETARTSAPPDPAWSGKTEQLIRAFGASEKRPGASIEYAACGPTLCRAEMRFGDEQSKKRAVFAFQRFVGKSLQQMTMYTPSGSDLSVLYLSRAGTVLPPMSEADLQAMK